MLTAIDQISRAPDFKFRIEKLLVLLIHKGPADDAYQLVRTQVDWVVVSFQADELLDPQRGSMFVRSRIADVVGELDLFGMSSAITSDKYFFGRDELVQTLVSRSVSRCENLGLFGLRKTGKTSVLFAVRRRLADRAVLADYLDCQNPGIHAARWWKVLENLAVRCATTLKEEKGCNVGVRASYSQADAGTLFSSDIGMILAQGGIDHLVLMLDEVEYMTPDLSGALGQHWDQDFLPFWQAIRATHQESLGRFSFIVAGVNPACVERSHFGQVPNPIFQLAVPQYLEPLSVSAIRAMVRSIGRYSGLRFEEDVYGYLQSTYGGHPYLIRIACSEAWQTSDTRNPDRMTTIGAQAFLDLRARIRARLAQPIKDILLSLVWWYPEEYDLLQILAAGDSGFVSEYLRAKPDSMLQFARYGVLKQEGGEFAISDLKLFLNDSGQAYKRELSPFVRSDMPPTLLPELPDLETLGKLFEKRVQVEAQLRKAVLLYLGVRHNWDNKKIAEAMIKGISNRSDRPNPRDLFVGRTPQQVINDLYTLDLKTIVTANWEVMGSLFEGNKARFEMNVDTLNRARRVDAHGKSAASVDVVEFENSHAWLLARLARIPPM